LGDGELGPPPPPHRFEIHRICRAASRRKPRAMQGVRTRRTTSASMKECTPGTLGSRELGPPSCFCVGEGGVAPPWKPDRAGHGGNSAPRGASCIPGTDNLELENDWPVVFQFTLSVGMSNVGGSFPGTLHSSEGCGGRARRAAIKFRGKCATSIGFLVPFTAGPRDFPRWVPIRGFV